MTPTSGFAQIAAQLGNLLKPETKLGDAKRGAQKLYDLSSIKNPPLRLLLGQDAIAIARQHLQAISKEIDAYESWSAELRED